MQSYSNYTVYFLFVFLGTATIICAEGQKEVPEAAEQKSPETEKGCEE